MNNKVSELANKLFNIKPNEKIVNLLKDEVFDSPKDFENYQIGIDLATGKDYTVSNK